MAMSTKGGNGSKIDESEYIMIRFRNFFPNSSRKALTTEFTKLVSAVLLESKKSSRTPLTLIQLKSALCKCKPEFQGHFTDVEFNIIFNYLDSTGTDKISLFEFTKGVRVSIIVVIYNHIPYRFLTNMNAYPTFQKLLG